MIRNNLAVLMRERGIKNSILSLKTGISKNTISSTAQNDGKMIQLETINKICQVLDITPNEFFEYTPIDALYHVDIDEESSKGLGPSTWGVTAFIKLTKNEELISAIEYTGYITEDGWTTFPDGTDAQVLRIVLEPDEESTTDELEKLSVTFQTKIKNDFGNAIREKALEGVSAAEFLEYEIKLLK